MVIFANVREYNYFLKSLKRIFELAHLTIFERIFPELFVEYYWRTFGQLKILETEFTALRGDKPYMLRSRPVPY